MKKTSKNSTDVYFGEIVALELGMNISTAGEQFFNPMMKKIGRYTMARVVFFQKAKQSFEERL